MSVQCSSWGVQLVESLFAAAVLVAPSSRLLLLLLVREGCSVAAEVGRRQRDHGRTQAGRREV